LRAFSDQDTEPIGSVCMVMVTYIFGEPDRIAHDVGRVTREIGLAVGRALNVTDGEKR
jgi:hypothetical protein